MPIQLVPIWMWWFLVPAIIWASVWRGIALWRAARNRQVAWFVVMCVVNTLGILEILYIFVFSRKRE